MIERRQRLVGPWRVQAFSLLALPRESTPLLRVGNEVIVLDELFLWEAVTSGLYWRILDHLKATTDGGTWQAWSRAYAEMIELLAEDLIKEIAPNFFDGSSSFFAEDDIKAAFPAQKGMKPLNCDAGVVLFAGVNRPIPLAARSGDLAVFNTDANKAVVVEKTRQLDGTAELLRQSPQPAMSPLKKPTGKPFPMVVCGNGFPLSPVNYVEERLRAEGWLQQPGIQPLAVVDPDELEACASLAKAGKLPPGLLSGWLGSTYAKGLAPPPGSGAPRVR